MVAQIGHSPSPLSSLYQFVNGPGSWPAGRHRAAILVSFSSYPWCKVSEPASIRRGTRRLGLLSCAFFVALNVCLYKLISALSSLNSCYVFIAVSVAQMVQ